MLKATQETVLDVSADTDIALWLEQQTGKSLLRFLTCGSVDDGK
jgi:bifunctional enzyme CysN/CysC